MHFITLTPAKPYSGTKSQGIAFSGWRTKQQWWRSWGPR